MLVMATGKALDCLRRALDREWLENLDIVLRIHIVRHDHHNNAVQSVIFEVHILSVL